MTSKALTTWSVIGRWCCSARATCAAKTAHCVSRSAPRNRVEAAFAHLHHFGQREQVGKGIEIVVEHEISVRCPPRMDAGCIERPGLGVPQLRTAHGGLWQTHDALAGRGVEAVGVEIKEGLFLLHSSRYRVISVPTPRMAAQNAAHGEPKSFERAVFAQGFDGVL